MLPQRERHSFQKFVCKPSSGCALSVLSPLNSFGVLISQLEGRRQLDALSTITNKWFYVLLLFGISWQSLLKKTFGIFQGPRTVGPVFWCWNDSQKKTRKALRELESTETSRLKRLMALLVEYGHLLLQDHFSSDPVKSYLLMFFFKSGWFYQLIWIFLKNPHSWQGSIMFPLV